MLTYLLKSALGKIHASIVLLEIWFAFIRQSWRMMEDGNGGELSKL
jgi:hypothetical protein